MLKLALALALTMPAIAGSEEPQQVAPSVDSAAQRASLRVLSHCLAKARPRWARQILAHPYLSKEQASMATMALAGNDTCVRGPEAEVTIRTSGLVGSLAEYFLVANGAGTSVSRISQMLDRVPALNASEDFALCVASRDPVAARDLAISEPGGSAEAGAVQRLGAAIKPCRKPGESSEIDLQSLRALMAVALYRGMTSTGAARS